MRLSALEGHRRWAPIYDSAPNPLLALESRVLPAFIGPVSSLRVVDVACGTGRWTARLQALGIDFCEEMLERSDREVRGRLVLADAAWLPIASAVADLTVCSFALGYFPDAGQAITEMARITRRGGRVIVSDLHPEAIAAGWTRSFRAAGVVYELEHYPHSPAKMFRFDSEQHLHFGEPERPIFEAAGKSLNQAARIPALWIGSWRKP